MKKFSYKAKNSAGKTVSGKVEATDDKRAINVLREQGLVVFSLNPDQFDILSLIFSKFFHRITISDLATFTRQLSSMITAGLTIDAALATLREQTSSSLAPVVDEILKNIEGGSSLAEAMSRHPEVFNPVYVALVRAGEMGGVLDEVLARLAENLEKQREFNGKVKGAMIYPAVIIIGMVVVGTIMMIFVIPKLLSMYKEFQVELPTPTLILINISNFMVSFWWLLLLAIAGAVFLFRSFRRTPGGRRKVDELILHLPVIGPLQTQIILTEVTSILGLLVGAGVSIVDSLNITAAAAGNAIFEEKLKICAKQVEKGLPLAASLRVYEEFPPIVPQMVSVGEETGKMNEVLGKLSRYFELESEQMVKGLTTLIEPLIMVLLGIGVGFLIIAVILPIYNLTSAF